MWNFKAIVSKIGSNLLDIATSKTTWMAVAGYVAMIPMPGLSPALKLAIPLGLKLIQQASADHGKNTAATPAAK